MQNYENELTNETEYFDKMIALIKTKLSKKVETSEQNRRNLLLSRKEMWNDASHSSEDFDNAVEISQYMEELNVRTSSYIAGSDEIQRLERMKESPYFARIDFCESGNDEKEKIYIGRYSLIDDDTYDMYVFDWRSPIAGIFYRFELGKVQYQAPGGIIYGDVSLKRQYEIKHGNFEYFFDANVQISDEFLRKLLSKNASPKMVSIVETIQKDQDVIIRDSKNDLLMVQGTAGSGKTSVALHRAAYLMYRGLSSKLSSNNIVILSPSNIFAQYISNVLPELGEDNVETLSFEEICNRVLGKDFRLVQTRNQFFEKLITCTDSYEKKLIKSCMEFKASDTFAAMLKRLIIYYERRLIPFGDIYYNNKQIFSRHYLKAKLLNRDVRISITSRLKQIEYMIFQEIRKENKLRLGKLERFMSKYSDYIFEPQVFARMLSIRENKNLLNYIHKFTEIDYYSIYHRVFHDKNLFYNLAKGFKLPENIEEIRQHTDESLSLNTSYYEDAIAVMFLKIKMSGCDVYKNIKQVIIDEVQDYYPLHFEILRVLFPEAKYTVLGDVNQTIEKHASLNFYDEIRDILDKKSSALLNLSKSFRCTRQIIAFSSRFIDNLEVQECFSRDGIPPEIVHSSNRHDLDDKLNEFVKSMEEQKYKSICILCKSLKASAELYERIKDSLKVVLAEDTSVNELSGTFIIPVYMAKGLEFDAVVIYGVDDENYQSEDDKNLLYIASTRALHRLAVFYKGRQSRFLAESMGGTNSD